MRIKLKNFNVTKKDCGKFLIKEKKQKIGLNSTGNQGKQWLQRIKKELQISQYCQYFRISIKCVKLYFYNFL